MLNCCHTTQHFDLRTSRNISVLAFRHVLLKEAPVIPACFLIHDNLCMNNSLLFAINRYHLFEQLSNLCRSTW